MDSIDGKIIRQKVNRKSLQASPKVFRQESLCSLTGMSGILIGGYPRPHFLCPRPDPVSLWHHLDHDFSHLHPDPVIFATILLFGGVSGGRYQPHSGFDGNRSMHLLSKGKGKTAAGTTDQHYKSMLKSLSPEKVLAADRNPI